MTTKRLASFQFRALAAALAVTAASPALLGAPSDIAAVSAPELDGNKPPAPTKIDAGDWSVASRTGAFSYQVPLVAVPGHEDATPHLSLSYNSQGSTYGSPVGANWTIEGLPEISLDPDQPVNEVTDGDEQRYVSGLSGGQRLVPTDDNAIPEISQTYRAIRDPNIRYERAVSDGWRAYDLGDWCFSRGKMIARACSDD